MIKKFIEHSIFYLAFIHFSAVAAPGADQVRRLELQHQLDARAPLFSAAWIGTHNSYNNKDKGYAFPNNKVNMIDQLKAGFRILNYDLHYAYGDIRLCHSSYGSELCGPGDTPLGKALDRLKDWLKDNPTAVVMIGIEDQIKSDPFINTHNLAADKIERKLKDFVFAPKWYRPAKSGKCQSLPIDRLTKQDVLDAGKQVIMASFSGCKGTSDRFQKWVWDLKLQAYKGNEGPNANDLNHPSKLSSVYEDRVFGSGPVDTLNDNQVKASLQKGANIIALDFGVKINRHPGAVWSWAENQPDGANTENCASVNADGQWHDTACHINLPFACQHRDTGQWTTTTSTGSWTKGLNHCKALGLDYIFAAPVNAQENRQLAINNGADVWVSASDNGSEGQWRVPFFRYEYLQNGNNLTLSLQRFTRAVNKEAVSAHYNFTQTPSVFLSAPSYRDSDPGLLVLEKVNKDRAKVQFLEWDYQNNKHAKEDFDLLAVPDGVYYMSDNSIWETGRFKIHDTKTGLKVHFKNNFSRIPYLFLTIQGPKSNDRVIVRANQLNKRSFMAALYEQEKSTDGHRDITVSYLAIMPPFGKQQSTINTASGTFDYKLQALEINHQWLDTGRYEYHLQEEKSLDNETAHIHERVHILSLSNIELAQIVTLRGPDTVNLRRR